MRGKFLTLCCLFLTPVAFSQPPQGGGRQPMPESMRTGSALDLEGKYAEARQEFSKAIETAATPQAKAMAQRSMAMSYAFEGNCPQTVKYEQMVFDYYVAQKDFYQQGEIADEAARVCIDAGDLETALKWYKIGHDAGLQEPDIKADRKDLWEFRWEHAQARIAARRGNKAEAAKHVAAAKAILDRKTNPAQETFFPYLTGYVAFYSGDYKAAAEDFQKANERDPFILCMLGQAYEKLGEKDKALECYRKAVAARAHNPPAAYAIPFAKKRLASSS
jgi:tetratricopeptide (TPR) repeat protein